MWAAERARRGLGPTLDRVGHLPRRARTRPRTTRASTARPTTGNAFPARRPHRAPEVNTSSGSRSCGARPSTTARFKVELEAEVIAAQKRGGVATARCSTVTSPAWPACSRGSTRTCPNTCAASAKSWESEHERHRSNARPGGHQRGHQAHDHDPGAALSHGRDDGTRPQRGGVRRGRRLLRRRVPLHRGPAGQVRQVARASTRRSPSRASSAPPSAWAPTACARCRRDPVRRLRLPGLRPDRQRGRKAALPLATATSPRR
jgi:hypothetical protein